MYLKNNKTKWFEYIKEMRNNRRNKQFGLISEVGDVKELILTEK
jgi:hypothetical protein